MRVRFRDIDADFVPLRRRQCDLHRHAQVGDAKDDAPVAVFSAGHVAKEHPEGLQIHAPSGEHVATMHGAHSAQIVDGLLHVFRKPRATTTDGPLSTRLAALNRRNQEFYAGGKR